MSSGSVLSALGNLAFLGTQQKKGDVPISWSSEAPQRPELMDLHPMKRRWRLWLTLTLLLLVGGAFMLPAVHWPVIGWVKGEVFYDGMPTSYWRNEASRCDSFPLAKSNTYGRNTVNDSSFQIARQRWLGSNDWHADHPLLRGDPAAVSLLLELLNDDDPQVKMIAAKGLANAGPSGRSASTELRRELDHEFGLVRDLAAEALHRIDPEEATRTGVPRPPSR
jgi:hypothetical protein